MKNIESFFGAVERPCTMAERLPSKRDLIDTVHSIADEGDALSAVIEELAQAAGQAPAGLHLSPGIPGPDDQIDGALYAAAVADLQSIQLDLDMKSATGAAPTLDDDELFWTLLEAARSDLDSLEERPTAEALPQSSDLPEAGDQASRDAVLRMQQKARAILEARHGTTANMQSTGRGTGGYPIDAIGVGSITWQTAISSGSRRSGMVRRRLAGPARGARTARPAFPPVGPSN